MAIIYRKVDGSTYAYESSSFWVPELGQPRSKRKYLGVVDETTGEIIPSSGKRGRKPGTTIKKTKHSADHADDILAAKDQEIRKLKEELGILQKENRQYRDLLLKIHTISQIE